MHRFWLEVESFFTGSTKIFNRLNIFSLQEV